MSNKYLPHLLVIPEDEANRQIITGFKSHLGVDSRRVQVEPVAGGWLRALEAIARDHAREMGRLPNRHLLILIDFDNHAERIARARESIPDNLKDRVFVLGCLSEPEEIRQATGMTKEQLGEALAEECLSGRGNVWKNDILAHNWDELERMKAAICRQLGS